MSNTKRPIAEQRILDTLAYYGGSYAYGVSALARESSPNRYTSNIVRHSKAITDLELSGMIDIDRNSLPYIVKAV